MKNKEPRIRKARYLNILFVLIVLVGFTVFSSGGPQAPVNYQIADDHLILTGSKETPFTVKIPIGSITGLALVTNPDLGQYVSGVQSGKCLAGTRENKAYGVYAVYAFANVKELIEIRTDEGVTLCNFESKDATEKLYAALQELIRGSQQNAESEEVSK